MDPSDRDHDGAHDDETADGDRTREPESERDSEPEPDRESGAKPEPETERSRERDWEFSLEDVGPEAEVERRLEPQSIDPANALFVLLGAAAAMGVIWSLLL